MRTVATIGDSRKLRRAQRSVRRKNRKSK